MVEVEICPIGIKKPQFLLLDYHLEDIKLAIETTSTAASRCP